MLEQAWAFLTDPENRAVLAWLGGGLVVVLTGAWIAFTYFHRRRGDTDPRAAQGPSTSVRVTGGVGSGHDLRARDIAISGPPLAAPARPEPPSPPTPGASREGAKPRKKRRRR